MADTFADITFDQWAAINHKAGLDSGQVAPASLDQWIPTIDRRRLMAYLVLGSYVENVARVWSDKPTERKERREYGEAALLVSRTVSGVLGDHVTPLIPEAQRPPTSAPKPDLDPPPEDGDSPNVAAHRELYERLEQEAFDDWLADWNAWPQREAAQQWVTDWWDGQHVEAKIVESETRHTVPLGDGVLVLHASTRQQRPVLTVHDPAEYFPVLDGLGPGEFPWRIHLATEEVTDTGTLLHRRTYVQGPVLPALTDDGRLRYMRDGAEVTFRLGDLLDEDERFGLTTALPHHLDDALVPVLDDGTLFEDGDIFRQYPWGIEDHQCYVTYKVWRLADTKGEAVDRLDETTGTVQFNEDGDPMDHLALPWDFLPVYHVPGVSTSDAHYGRSILTRVLQLLDAIGDADTDLERAAALAAGPVIFVPRHSLGDNTKFYPGTMIGKGEGAGSVDQINTAQSLNPLGKYRDDLLDRLETVTEIGKAGMGRVTGDQVPSGVALRLSFTTFEQLISYLRITRHMKYPLMLKGAWRIGQAMGWTPEGTDGLTPTFSVVFGNTTPTDVEATVNQLARLLEAKGVSRETAVQVLAELGFPVDDVATETERIAATDFAGAQALSSATESPAMAAEYVGRELTDQGGPTPQIGVEPAGDLPGPLE